jgi:glycosyltransferase involved in cell wall biosynthesis
VIRLAFAVPGDLNTPTGGYAYDRRIVGGLRHMGWNVEVIDLGNGFPFPPAETRAAALARLAAIPKNLPVVIDGLAFGALPDLAADFCRTHRVIALVHHPLALETGLAPGEADALRGSERAALAAARLVIATSTATAHILVADYGLDPQRLRIVRPGQDRVAPARGGDGAPVALLAVGALVPRKGYDVLVAALDQIADLPWRLVIAGDRTRDPATAAEIAAEIARRGLAARIALAGAVSEARLAELYAAADLFVLASRFEGYGMAFAAAIAYGLPVIGSGAVPEAVPPEAGLLVPPDDVGALASALRLAVAERAAREKLAAGARAAALSLPTWEESATLFAVAIESVR